MKMNNYSTEIILPDKLALKIFIFLMLTHFIIWTILPLLIVKGTYVDVLENLTWGRHLQWGYDKNPFFGAFITYSAYLFTGKWIQSSYVMSQICVATCFITIWKLAKRMLPSSYALISVTILTGILYYNFITPEFNDNILELPLWALTIYFFYQALQNQKIKNWLFVGLFAALSLMTKYYAIMLFASMFVFTICNKTARKSFKNPGIYYAGLLFLIIVTPNFIWLVKNDFVSFSYAYSRADIANNYSRNLNNLTNNSFLNSLFNPVIFLLYLLLITIIPIATFRLCFKNKSNFNTTSNFNKNFITIMFLGPIFCTILFSFCSGARLLFPWGEPLLNLFGIFIIQKHKPLLNKKNLKKYFIIICVTFIFWVLLYIIFETIYPLIANNGRVLYEIFPAKNVALTLTDVWHKNVKAPLKYIAGKREYTTAISIFSSDKPISFFEWKKQHSQWVNITDLKKQGAMFVWPGKKANKFILPILQRRYPGTKFLGIYSFRYLTHNTIVNLFKFKQVPPLKLAVAYLPPKSGVGDPGSGNEDQKI